MLSGDSTQRGARAPVLTVVLNQGRYQLAAAGPHSCKHTHTHRVNVLCKDSLERGRSATPTERGARRGAYLWRCAG